MFVSCLFVFLCFLLLVSRDSLYIFIINPLSILYPSFSLAFSFINGSSNINIIKYISILPSPTYRSPPPGSLPGPLLTCTQTGQRPHRTLQLPDLTPFTEDGDLEQGMEWEVHNSCWMIEWQAAELAQFPSKMTSAHSSRWISRLALKTQEVLP